ncbi:uncharacterized protein BX664DRAFT_328591 [Halteromyces radiatus]|uniref:uncharacterized protein n=1 Tax=Halteromyces radiatus TaxID=101107 RepID=UPI00221FA32C|nr:uncharacterized protein BX664DRAFT_328591 [Halteromyces radiatus]KAI8092959.1 hypothetical protein BX664DRAFT_328591 [Halteromyces radiatus]
MSKQEQDNLEKTLNILSKKLLSTQIQYRHTKQTVHTKHAFLLGSKTVLQNDLAHVFKLDQQKRKRTKNILQPPPGLLPLLSHKGISHNNYTPSDSLIVHSCTANLQHDRVYFRMTIINQTVESILQAHLVWMSPLPWTPFALDRSTLYTIPSSSTQVLYAATTIPSHLLFTPQQLTSMDIKAACRYMTENGDWLQSSSIHIQWVDSRQWMKDDIDSIQNWAPILYPYQLHLSSTLSSSSLQHWIHLNDDVHLTSDGSLLFIQGNPHFSPIQGHLYSINNQSLASWLEQNKHLSNKILPWDGMALDTSQRLQKSIVSLVDQAHPSSSSSHLANRENSLAHLSTLL